jgi:hypothetical protein
MTVQYGGGGGGGSSSNFGMWNFGCRKHNHQTSLKIRWISYSKLFVS